MMNVGSCYVCGKYCSPKEQIIVRPCHHNFHVICYSNVIGTGESRMYCPVNGCQIGRPPFCGGCFNPIYSDELNILSLFCGHHFHRTCYEAKLLYLDQEYGTCPSSRCIPYASREPEGKRTLEQSATDVDIDDGQTGGSSSTEIGTSTSKRTRNHSEDN